MLTFLLNPFLLPFVILLFIKWQFFPPKTTGNPPPSPLKLPIIGNFHQLGTLPHQSLRSLSIRYGPLMLIHLGNVPTVVASSADAACEIMKTHDIVFASRPESKLAKKLLYDCKTVSAAPYGDHWRQLKSIMVLQLLSTKRVRFFRSVRAKETALLLEIIDDLDNKPVNLSDLFVTYTNNVTCEVVLGRKYGEGPNGKKFKQLLREFLVTLGSVNIGDFIPCLAWVDRVNGSDREVERIAREIDEFVEGVVEERKKKHRDTAGNVVDYDNFVDIVLKIQQDETDGILLDKTNIKALLLDAYTAGTDTTATVLEWVMAELLRHPNIMKKARDEVRGVSGSKTGLAEEDIEKMTYLKAVIKETLRLHPPLPLLVPNIASKDVRVMGYDIPKGTTVMTNVWAIGRDPKLWDEPQEFRPERFLGSSIDFKGHDFELIPFGAGRRICPGIVFAMATNENLIANLLYKYDWKLANGEIGEDLDMTECPGVAVRKRVPLLAVAIPT
ncbi:cytochrome P450 71A8-like [Cynara cardunculus var. scolymus]|uniref:cytochrome P450 71A8-like n=1 Tax=Cynara cardunculus var. scolymus TaxID=59895 RepID=UPI000D62E1FF|nr:cytochrome P450 71A8-like [Cynara cardunculus var. scolymus]